MTFKKFLSRLRRNAPAQITELLTDPSEDRPLPERSGPVAAFNRVDLLMRVEEVFRVEIHGHEEEQLITYGDLFNLVVSKLTVPRT